MITNYARYCCLNGGMCIDFTSWMFQSVRNSEVVLELLVMLFLERHQRTLEMVYGRTSKLISIENPMQTPGGTIQTIFGNFSEADVPNVIPRATFCGASRTTPMKNCENIGKNISI